SHTFVVNHVFLPNCSDINTSSHVNSASLETLTHTHPPTTHSLTHTHTHTLQSLFLSLSLFFPSPDIHLNQYHCGAPTTVPISLQTVCVCVCVCVCMCVCVCLAVVCSLMVYQSNACLAASPLN